MADCMPKAQFEFISKIQADLLESTNLTKEDAWRFGFLCWQNGYAKAECGNGWIPVEKALPKEYCNCLVTRKKEYSDGSFDYLVRDDVWIELEGCWGWQSEFEGWIENIIAWMPLPEAYKPTTD